MSGRLGRRGSILEVMGSHRRFQSRARTCAHKALAEKGDDHRGQGEGRNGPDQQCGEKRGGRGAEETQIKSVKALPINTQQMWGENITS